MNNKQPTYKVIDPVGSIKNWYRKANQYWDVIFAFNPRKLKLPMMVFLVDLEI